MFVLFFKQKTAYELRISDWSSDVCSSDLHHGRGGSLMARFSEASLLTATEIISRYPRPKSALFPLLHLAQEQDGYVANDAKEHIAELVGVTPAEVLGT